MFEDREFPSAYMIERKWSIEQITSHPEFSERVNLICEQCSKYGINFGEETLKTARFIRLVYKVGRLTKYIEDRLRINGFLFSDEAYQVKLKMFRNDNSPDLIEQIGLRKKQSSRAIISDEEDRLIISLQKKHGNKWSLIAKLMAETIDTEMSSTRVKARFKQLELENTEGHVKRRKVNWTEAEDAQVIAFHDEWLEKNHGSKYGMWGAMAKVIPGKNDIDYEIALIVFYQSHQQ